MERTKYDDFVEAMENLTNEKIKQDCKLLIYLARIYYSHYKQFKELVKVKRKLLHIYKVEDGKLLLKKGELSIAERLYLDFYFKLFQEDIKYKTTNSKWFKDAIRLYDKTIPDLFEEYKLNENTSQILQNNLKKVCRRARKQQKKNLNLGIENIREAVNLFQEYKTIEIFPEKECFNRVFSDAYIDVLIDKIKNEDVMYFLYVAPVRAQLSYNGGEIDSSATKWCYNEDFRYTISDLENEIYNYIRLFDETIQKFVRIENSLNKNLSKIRLL